MVFLAAALSTGCSSTPSASTDGGVTLPDGATVDAGLDFAIAAPEPPLPPALPVLTPCPSGWVASDGFDGPVTCEPLPGPNDACAADAARFVGDSGCAPIGRACPAGLWPEDLPATGVLYVDAGASAGGTGTRGDPFATIPEALAAASTGAIIALAKGTHAPPGTISVGVELRGACVGETLIACGPGEEGFDPLLITVTGVAIRDVHVADCRTGIFVPMRTDADYTVDNVLLTGHSYVGILGTGGRGTVQSLVIREPRLDPATPHTGWGIGMNFGATLHARRVVIEGAAGYPILVSSEGTMPGGETFAEFEDLVARDTVPEGGTRYDGNGLTVNYGARVVVRRALFANNHATGASARYGGSLELQDVVVRDTHVQEIDGSFGLAFAVGEGSRLSVRRAWLHDNPLGGVIVQDAGSTATLEDVVVQGSAGHPITGLGGVGLMAFMGAELSVSRALVESLRGVAVATAVGGSHVDIEDLTVRSIRGQPLDGLLGWGAVAVAGATAALRRVSIEDVRVLGAGAVDVGAEMSVEDLTVRDVHVDDGSGIAGSGACAAEGGHLTLARGLFERVVGAGLAAISTGPMGTQLTATDTVIRDTHDAVGHVGAGVLVTNGDAVLSRMRVEGFTGVGVLAFAANSSISVEDAVILDGTGLSSDGIYGYGVSAEDSASITARRVFISHAREFGVFVAAGSLVLDQAAVQEVELNGTRIRARGINVQEGGVIEATDVSVSGAADFGVLVRDEGAELHATGLRVADTRGVPCEGDCATAGNGVGTYFGGHAGIRDFLVTRSLLVGVQVAHGGTMDLSQGEVSHCRVGANVETDGFDVTRLTDQVTYRDNDVNLQSNVLPVPDPGLPTRELMPDPSWIDGFRIRRP